MTWLRWSWYGALVALVANSPLAGQVDQGNAFPTDAEREATIRRAHADAEAVGTAGYFIGGLAGGALVGFGGFGLLGFMEGSEGVAFAGSGAGILGLTLALAYQGRGEPSVASNRSGADAMELDELYQQAFRARLSERRRKATRNGGLVGMAAGLGFLLFAISATTT